MMEDIWYLFKRFFALNTTTKEIPHYKNIIVETVERNLFTLDFQLSLLKFEVVSVVLPIVYSIQKASLSSVLLGMFNFKAYFLS